MDPLDYLFGLEKLGIKFGLANITAICAALGDPQNAYRSVIVAGTNGKGSVSAMVETGLRAAGVRTGLYTSPHLVRIEERFVVAGRAVASEDLRAAAADVQATVARLRAKGTLETEPTFFEVTTAIGFDLFRRLGIELAVLEVGLGGRFDATNVATPVAAAITTIDIDHERFLGSTIREIASEKAGVIKPGMAVVAGESKPDAAQVFETVCAERGARLIRAWEGVTAECRMSAGLSSLRLVTPRRAYPEVVLALRGRHQVHNAVVAVRLLETLDQMGLVQVGEAAVLAALTRTSWPGRLQLVEPRPDRRLLLDAAHNPAGARVLADYLCEAFPAGLPLVFGAMRDKDIGGILDVLLPCVTSLVATAPRTPRAASAEAVAETARRRRPDLPVVAERDAVAAVERAWGTGRLVLVAGSIFLVGELIARLEVA